MSRLHQAALLFSLLSASIAGTAEAQRSVSFRLEVVNGPTATFQSVSGLATETEVIEYRDGAGGGEIHKLPGARKYGDITLKRGVTADKSLWMWKAAFDADGATRFAGRITMYDRQGSPVASWNFQQAWPRKIDVASDEANDTVIESITIVVERIERP